MWLETRRRQIGAHRADRRRDRHVVVVEDDDQPRFQRARRCSSPHRPCRPTSRRRRSPRQRCCRRPRDRGPPPCRAPAEIEVEECAAPNGSYSLSERLVKPDRPPPWRSVRMRVAPAGQDLVRIGLMADVPDQPVARACRRHSAARPSARRRRGPAPRWPPVTETALIVSARNSSATLTSSLALRLRRSDGDPIRSRSGVLNSVTAFPATRLTLVHFAPPRKRESYTKIERCANSLLPAPASGGRGSSTSRILASRNGGGIVAGRSRRRARSGPRSDSI